MHPKHATWDKIDIAHIVNHVPLKHAARDKIDIAHDADILLTTPGTKSTWLKLLANHNLGIAHVNGHVCLGHAMRDKIDIAHVASDVECRPELLTKVLFIVPSWPQGGPGSRGRQQCQVCIGLRRCVTHLVDHLGHGRPLCMSQVEAHLGHARGSGISEKEKRKQEQQDK